MLQPREQDQRWRGCFETVPVHLQPVLMVLLSGITDAAACNRLHVSPRTFSRRLAELLDHFGVETRFQAGMEFAMSCRGRSRSHVVETRPAPCQPPRPRIAGRTDPTGL
ncbi:hypothetical protein Ais01nite_02970 [Asanoa ishikariensis]|uniref:PucR C-terminal helix-turn-helix domain-containing protein n=1 Tax=Asanoa ishikariensis TaxID=137265 RepID=A0A1H3TL71_9ACTN|nr:hypothetical protein [Asanoa ishikariensis]GIF62262.1 hypothetical protein Ais01nite_02970 [Asanoa ishikariensis]SDZ50618.1 hypothetical protein SAMN05421684_5934 [Asanoa ishikariensis]